MAKNLVLLAHEYSKTGPKSPLGGDLEGLVSGFYYYSDRYYNPNGAPMFISPDRMQDLYPHVSPYVYCLNNSLRYVDRDGKAPDDVFNTRGEFLYSTPTGNDIVIEASLGNTQLMSSYLNTLGVGAISQRQTLLSNIANHYAKKSGVEGDVALGMESPSTPAYEQAGGVYLNFGFSRWSTLNNYYNLMSIFDHEGIHQKKGNSKSFLDHAKVYLEQMKMTNFSKATENFQVSMISSFSNYCMNAFRSGERGVSDLIYRFNNENGMGYSIILNSYGTKARIYKDGINLRPQNYEKLKTYGSNTRYFE